MPIIQAAGLMDLEPRYERYCDFCDEYIGELDGREVSNFWVLSHVFPDDSAHFGADSKDYEFCSWECTASHVHQERGEGVLISSDVHLQLIAALESLNWHSSVDLEHAETDPYMPDELAEESIDKLISDMERIQSLIDKLRGQKKDS